jgi:hypothetical protein
MMLGIMRAAPTHAHVIWMSRVQTGKTNSTVMGNEFTQHCRIIRPIPGTPRPSCLPAMYISPKLSAAGASDLFVAQMIGHSSPCILQRYSKAIDEYRRDAIRKLEELREAHKQQSGVDSNAD